MKTPFSRRDFLRATGIVVALAGTTPLAFATQEAPALAKRAHKKGIMWGTIGVKGSVLEKMRAVKAAGFDGVEMTSHLDQAEVLAASAETGLEINSVCGAHQSLGERSLLSGRSRLCGQHQRNVRRQQAQRRCKALFP
jgi:hypothetical protein